MFDRWVESLRGRASDRRKALQQAQEASATAYRQAVGDFDSFVPIVSDASPPAFSVGTTHDSMGRDVRVWLPLRHLDAHWLVQGATGSGKSRFVTALFVALVRSLLGVAIIDCKAGLFEAAVRWLGVIALGLRQAARAAFVGRVTVIDLFGPRLVPFNVCAAIPGMSVHAQASDIALSMERLFDVGFSVHMNTIMKHVIALLIATKLTLAEATLVLEDEVLRGVLAERCALPALREFFLRTYPAMPEPPKTALRMRLHALFFSESLLALGADTMIDFRSRIAGGEILVIALGKQGPEEEVKVAGNLLLQALFNAAYQARATETFSIVADEFFHVLDAPNLTARFASALTTLRSFRVGLCLVLHHLSQVAPTLRELLISNCALNAIFRSSARNAEFLADFAPGINPQLVRQALRSGRPLPSAAELRRIQLEALQRLPRQEFWWYDHRQPHRALHIRGNDVPDPHEAAGLSASALDRFVSDTGLDIGALAVTRDDIRRQIAQRRDALEQLVRPPIVVTTETSGGVEPPPNGRRRRPQLG